MAEAPPEPAPFAWLDPTRVLRWLQLTELAADDPRVTLAEDCRRAAADWLQDARRDLHAAELDLDGQPVFLATEKLIQAGVLAAARLYARRSSPAGLASYAELGAAEVLRADPDVGRLAGLGRYAPPRFG